MTEPRASDWNGTETPLKPAGGRAYPGLGGPAQPGREGGEIIGQSDSNGTGRTTAARLLTMRGPDAGMAFPAGIGLAGRPALAIGGPTACLRWALVRCRMA